MKEKGILIAKHVTTLAGNVCKAIKLIIARNAHTIPIENWTLLTSANANQDILMMVHPYANHVITHAHNVLDPQVMIAHSVSWKPIGMIILMKREAHVHANKDILTSDNMSVLSAIILAKIALIMALFLAQNAMLV